jgi:hypothetical protein
MRGVRQGFRLLFVIAAVPLLTGCFYFPPVGVDGSSSEDAALSAAESNVRAAVPAIEAYYADNGSYDGATVEKLRATYDAGIPQDVHLVRAEPLTYCLESTVSGQTYSKPGPSSEIVPGPCAPKASREGLPEPAALLHLAADAMEMYRAQHGSYEGASAQALQQYVPGLDGFVIVEARPQSYCLETESHGAAWSARGPSGDVGVGAC